MSVEGTPAIGVVPVTVGPELPVIVLVAFGDDGAGIAASVVGEEVAEVCAAMGVPCVGGLACGDPRDPAITITNDTLIAAMIKITPTSQLRGMDTRGFVGPWFGVGESGGSSISSGFVWAAPR